MGSPKEVFAKIEEQLKADPAKAKEIDGIFKFDVTGAAAGIWIVDCKAVAVTEGDGEADVTITVGDDDLVAIDAEELDAMQAFMLGKVQVEGDMGLAMKLQEIL